MMTIIIQRHNLFLSPIWEEKTIIGEQTCHWLVLHSFSPESLQRALCHCWDVCRRQKCWTGVSVTCELRKTSTDTILALPSMQPLSQGYGFALSDREIPESSMGCVLFTATGTYLNPNLGTSCDWKEGEEGAECEVGLRNHQTLMWVSLPILSNSAICNSRHHYSFWRQSFRNPGGWNVHIISASSLLLCWFIVLSYWYWQQFFFSFFNIEITTTVKKQKVSLNFLWRPFPSGKKR